MHVYDNYEEFAHAFDKEISTFKAAMWTHETTCTKRLKTLVNNDFVARVAQMTEEFESEKRAKRARIEDEKRVHLDRIADERQTELETTRVKKRNRHQDLDDILAKYIVDDHMRVLCVDELVTYMDQ